MKYAKFLPLAVLGAIAAYFMLKKREIFTSSSNQYPQLQSSPQPPSVIFADPTTALMSWREPQNFFPQDSDPRGEVPVTSGSSWDYWKWWAVGAAGASTATLIAWYRSYGMRVLRERQFGSRLSGPVFDIEHGLDDPKEVLTPLLGPSDVTGVVRGLMNSYDTTIQQAQFLTDQAATYIGSNPAYAGVLVDQANSLSVKAMGYKDILRNDFGINV